MKSSGAPRAPRPGGNDPTRGSSSQRGSRPITPRGGRQSRGRSASPGPERTERRREMRDADDGDTQAPQRRTPNKQANGGASRDDARKLEEKPSRGESGRAPASRGDTPQRSTPSKEPRDALTHSRPRQTDNRPPQRTARPQAGDAGAGGYSQQRGIARGGIGSRNTRSFGTQERGRRGILPGSDRVASKRPRKSGVTESPRLMFILFGLVIVSVLLLKFQMRFAHVHTKDHAIVHTSTSHAGYVAEHHSHSSDHHSQETSSHEAPHGGDDESHDHAHGHEDGHSAAGGEHTHAHASHESAGEEGEHASSSGGSSSSDSNSVGTPPHDSEHSEAGGASSGEQPRGGDGSSEGTQQHEAAQPVGDQLASEAAHGNGPTRQAGNGFKIELFRAPARIAPSDEPPVFWDYITENGSDTRPRWFFQLANKDRLGSFQPLCLSKEGSLVLSGALTCGGKETRKYFRSHCRDIQTVVLKDLHLGPTKIANEREIAAEGKANVQFAKGSAVVLGMDKHTFKRERFLGRVMFLFHVLQNFKAYTMAKGSDSPARVLIVPPRDVLRALLRPEMTGYWYHALFSAVLHPHKFEVVQNIDTLEEAMSKPVPKGTVSALIVPNTLLSEKMLCFENAVVPTMLRGRMFVSDHEYPSESTGWAVHPRVSIMLKETTGIIPSDAIKFRTKLLTLMFENKGTPGTYEVDKRIVLLDKINPADETGGGAFRNEDRDRLVALIKSKASGYSVEVVSTYDVPIATHIEALAGAVMMVSLSGPDTQSAVFLPPLAARLTIHRYGLPRGEEDLNIGVKEFSTSLTHGEEAPMMIQYASVAECLSKSKECEPFYLSAPPHVSEEDWSEIGNVLDKALAHVFLLEKEMIRLAAMPPLAQSVLDSL